MESDVNAEAMLECLREAVAEALERKRKLGQYAVVRRDGKLVALGGTDAPPELPWVAE